MGRKISDAAACVSRNEMVENLNSWRAVAGSRAGWKAKFWVRESSLHVLRWAGD